MKSTISWFEIPVEDIGRAVRFYEEVFDLNLQVLPLGQAFVMAFFPVEESGLSGALCWDKRFYRPSSDGVVLYFKAEPDIETILLRVKNAGGAIVIPKKQISPEAGNMAAFLDSEGNRIALYEKAAITS